MDEIKSKPFKCTLCSEIIQITPADICIQNVSRTYYNDTQMTQPQTSSYDNYMYKHCQKKDLKDGWFCDPNRVPTDILTPEFLEAIKKSEQAQKVYIDLE